MEWGVNDLGAVLFGDKFGEVEKKEVRKRVKQFLVFKGYNYKDFLKHSMRGRQYILPEKLAKEFLEWFKKRPEQVIINEEYIKSGKSIQKELEEFKKELAKIMLD